MPASILIGDINGPANDYLRLALNPERIDEELGTSYARIPIAQADWAPGTIGDPVEWGRNDPRMFDTELTFRASGNGDVEAEIKKLEGFRYKNARGEPPDLIFQMGKRQSIVRIERMSLSVQQGGWTDDLRRRWVKIRLSLIEMSQL